MTEQERHQKMARLRDLPLATLKSELQTAQGQIEELQQNFNRLRAGGCAMEALLEEARAELGLLEEELEARGENL